MRKIACVGYHATGAGVIDDLFREFDNVAQGTYEVETRLLQDPDGISDLEYYLVDNPHRLNSGYELKRFLTYVKNTTRSYKKYSAAAGASCPRNTSTSWQSFRSPAIGTGTSGC